MSSVVKQVGGRCGEEAFARSTRPMPERPNQADARVVWSRPAPRWEGRSSPAANARAAHRARPRPERLVRCPPHVSHHDVAIDSTGRLRGGEKHDLVDPLRRLGQHQRAPGALQRRLAARIDVPAHAEAQERVDPAPASCHAAALPAIRGCNAPGHTDEPVLRDGCTLRPRANQSRRRSKIRSQFANDSIDVVRLRYVGQ